MTRLAPERRGSKGGRQPEGRRTVLPRVLPGGGQWSPSAPREPRDDFQNGAARIPSQLTLFPLSPRERAGVREIVLPRPPSPCPLPGGEGSVVATLSFFP